VIKKKLSTWSGIADPLPKNGQSLNAVATELRGQSYTSSNAMEIDASRIYIYMIMFDCMSVLQYRRTSNISNTPFATGG